MPYLPTAQSWLHQSTLLLQARPTTTRITTKYTLQPAVSKPSRKHPNPSQAPSGETPASTSTSTSAAPKAYLVLKTYDPASGACLKYRTDKAAEVGRLIAALGRCGRVMAALPERAEPEEGQGEKMMVDGEGTGRSTPVPDAVGSTVKPPAGERGKAGGKKKKSKK